MGCTKVIKATEIHTSESMKREFTFIEYLLYAGYNFVLRLRCRSFGVRQLDVNSNSVTDYHVILGVFLTSLSLCFLVYKTSLLGVVVRLK